MQLTDIPYSHTRAPWPKRPDFWSILSTAFLTQKEIRNAWLCYYLWRPFRWIVIGGLQLILIFLCRFIKRSWIDSLSRFAAKKYIQPAMKEKIFAKALPGRISHILSTASSESQITEQKAHKLTDAWWQNTALSYSRFMYLNRYYQEPSREISCKHSEWLWRQRENGHPLLFSAVHLGDWELIVDHIQNFPGSRPICTTFEPRQDDFHNQLIYQRRKRVGTYVFPPGKRSAKYLFTLNKAGFTDSLLFIDEEAENLGSKSVFPLFGRECPGKSNVRRLARLALKYQRPIVPLYLLRNDDRSNPKNQLHVLPAIQPGANKVSIEEENILIRELSAAYEPVIRENIEQWYMLASTRFPK